VDLDLLRAFVTFAELGSLTAAARALHVSQPTLHGQLARLAATLRVPLYRRVGRGVQLTPEGARVLAFARETERRVGDLGAELRGATDRQPVILAAGQGGFLHLLGPAIRRFHESSSAPLRLLTRTGPEAIEALRHGETHLAVAAVGTVPDGVASDLLARIGARLLVPRRHPLARKRTIRLSDLEGERLIVPPPGAPHREVLSRALEAKGVKWELAVETQGWELFAHFVRLGLGLAVVNAFSRTPPGVYSRPMTELPSVTYRLLRRASSRLPAAAESLRAMILSTARKD
jgi:DNA-binding transcriptional LysR family regulator